MLDDKIWRDVYIDNIDNVLMDSKEEDEKPDKILYGMNKNFYLKIIEEDLENYII